MRRQRGWAGIVMLLVVVLIVAFLAKDALLKYLGPAPAPAKSGVEAGDPGAPAATTPMERARGLQDMMQKESEKRAPD